VDSSKITEDDLLGKALDAGATDMRRAEKAFEIVTAPAEMDAVREALHRARVPVLEGQVSFVPQSTVRVEGKDATSVVRLIEALYAEYRFPRTALLMAHARGVICLAARQCDVAVMALAPAEVKRAVAAAGAASKHQVQHSVRRILKLAALPTPSHVADA